MRLLVSNSIYAKRTQVVSRDEPDAAMLFAYTQVTPVINPRHACAGGLQ